MKFNKFQTNIVRWIVVLLCFGFITSLLSASESNYYVATNGDDHNPGTLAAPFKTIQKAASLVMPGDTVFLRGGTYRETVSPRRSGTSDLPITFMPYNGEEVVLSGGDLITGWIRHSGDIWRASCNWDGGSNRNGNTVFVNGELKYEAREFAETNVMDLEDWGQIAHGKMKSTYFTSNDLKGYGNDYWNGGTVRHHVNDWTIRDTVIKDYDSTSGRITFTESVGVISQKHAFGFYITHPNMYKTLDQPGEWFKRIGEDTLYYHTEPGQNPNTLEIENKRRGYAFDVSGRDYIHIHGLVFRGASIKTDANTEFNLIQGCRFYGHDRDYDGRLNIVGNYNVFRDNEVSETWAHGIALNGMGNQVINNYFHDINFGGVGSVVSLNGADHSISRNTARDFARHFVGRFPQRCGISYNLIEDGARLTWDTAFFDADVGGGTGGSCVIHHNVMRSPRTLGNYHAFYGGANITFHHNLMYDWDSRYPLVHGSRKSFVKYIHNTFVGKAPSLSHHQDFVSDVTEAYYSNNLQLSIDDIATIGVNCRGNHNYSSSDFVNLDQGDLRLKPSSNAIDTGIVLPGFNDGYRGEAPDAGALEFGEAMWDVGHDFSNPPYPDTTWKPLPGTNLFSNGQFLNKPSGWTYMGTPVWYFGNAWNAAGTGLSRLGLNSMQLEKGDGMSRIFSNLKPDTWYTVGCEVRLSDERIAAVKYNSSKGTLKTGSHREEQYVTGFKDRDWVCYNNIPFGTAGLYDQMEFTFSRPRGSDYNGDPASFEIRLGSASGELLAEIEMTKGVIDTWRTNQVMIPSLSGDQTICLVARGSGIPMIMLASVRLQNTEIPEYHKLTLGVTGHDSDIVTTSVGQASWQYGFETLSFKTGPPSTEAELFIYNFGAYDAYLDQLAVYEKDPIDYDPRDLVKSDGMVSTSDDTWQVDFVQIINVGRIEIFNIDTSDYRELSNFKVSAWSDDPVKGGRVLWQRDYFGTGHVARGGSLVITGDEIASDGVTRLASITPKVIRIQNQGVNAAGNRHLRLADVSIFNLQDAPAQNNLVPTGLVKQSSNYYPSEGHAKEAANNLIFPPFDFTSTQPFAQSWWQVDLLEPTVIDQIVLYNRADAGSRIGTFKVSVWDNDPDMGGGQLWSRNYAYPRDITDGGSLTINGSATSGGRRLDGLTKARVVRVQLLGTNFLHLGEVQVWRKPAETTPDPTPQDPILINATTNNGNLDLGTPYSGNWQDAVPSDKFYRKSPSVGAWGYMNGWTVIRVRYWGGNNTFGFNDTGALSSGKGDMVAFTNSSDIDLESDTIATNLKAGDKLKLSFIYLGGPDDTANGRDSRFTVTPVLILNGGSVTHRFSRTTAVDAADGVQAYSASVVLPGNYTSVALRLEMRNSGYGRAGYVDDIELVIIP